MRVVAGAGEREHSPALERRHLADHVGGGPEPVQPESLGVAGERQRAVADQPAAQQRRRLLVGESLGQRQAVALVGDRQLREPAVDVASGEARVHAQVLPSAPAVAALAVGPAQPRHAHPAAVVGAPDDLVPEHDRELRRLDLVVAQVEVGAADPAGPDRQQQLARSVVGGREG